MTTSRDIGDISTQPGGISGADWTQGTRSSVAALWALNGGMLLSVAGTNVLTAAVAISEGFSGYSDGLRASFVAANSNTGPATINIGGVGAKAVMSPDGDPLSSGAIVAGRLTEIVFYAADDHFRLVTSGGTTNVTVTGGLILQRSAPSRLVTAAGPATAATTVASQSFQCLYTSSRVIIEGNVGRVTGAGSSDVVGVVIGLYVDTVLVQSFTDHCQPSAQVNTPFYFSYLPANTDAHTYEIKVSSTISATYPKGANVIVCSEMSPNA
ncbi:MAG: hypothetical protein ACOH2N_00110 [Devosia sp.]